MELKSGARFRSAVCETEVVVTKGLADGPVLGCGGAPMVPAGPSGGSAGSAASAAPSGEVLDPSLSGGTVLGKRYTDESGSLEVLCVKVGAGTLTLDGVPLVLRQAKPLASSD